MNTTLTYEEAAALFRYDSETGKLYWREDAARNVRAGDEVGGYHPRDKYRLVTYKRTQYLVHRIVWLLHTGQWPAMFIDHINGERTDNRVSNLREADHAINAQNVHRPSRRSQSGVLGVRLRKGRYEAALQCGDRYVYIGMFATAEAAYAAYVNTKRELHRGCTL